LTANDSQFTSSEDLFIHVNPATTTNQAPAVALPTSVTIPFPPGSTTLTGIVTDSSGTPTLLWTKISGPGSVTFGSPTMASTSLTFSVPGTYVLRLTATDSQSLKGFADVIVNVVAPGNQPPVINLSFSPTVTLPASLSVTGTVTDDGLASGSTLIISWTKEAGPGKDESRLPHPKVRTAASRWRIDRHPGAQSDAGSGARCDAKEVGTGFG